MTALTQEQCDQYVRDGGGRCPFCRSEDITGRSFDCEDRVVTQEVSCAVCGRHWCDRYRLEAVQAIDAGTPAIRIERTLTCIRLDAPQWFEREDFAGVVRQLADPDPAAGRRMATWHVGQAMGQDSDVFIYWDDGDLSEPLPEDIHQELNRLAAAERETEECLFWIGNIPAQ